MEIENNVEVLRKRFLAKIKTFSEYVFHPSDVNRVKTDDSYLTRFLLHTDGDLEAAYTMLWETCTWRLSFGVNDICEENVNQTILRSGSVFSHGRDKDGRALLIFKSKKHKKDAHEFEDQKRCLVYWLERLEREENGEMISLFFDLDGATLGNMDVDYTLYLINLFKCYYPYFLNHIIVFEMAWVLNAVFRLIKSWLPPKAIEKLKFVDKSSVKNLVDAENCLVSWGGKDDYVFQFEPQRAPKPLPAPEENGHDIAAKKVHFAETSLENDKLEETGAQEEPTKPLIKLRIFPPDIMVFSEDGHDAVSTVLVRNEDSQCISFKIKTTSPEKFRVRPSCGVLGPGSSEVISIVLLRGYKLESLQRDKFLIMGIPVDKSTYSSDELLHLWKVTSMTGVHQCKVRCFMPPTNTKSCEFDRSSKENSVTDKKVLLGLCSDVATLNSYTESLKVEMTLIRKQQWVILLSVIFLLCSLWYGLYTDRTSQPFSQSCWTESRKD